MRSIKLMMLIRCCVLCVSLFLASCSTANKHKGESKYIDNLPTFDSDAVVLSTDVKEDEELYTDGQSFYALQYSGMQRRPILRNLNNGEQHKGVDADKALGGLGEVSPSKLGARKLPAGCFSSEEACFFDFEKSKIYLFSESQKLLESITLSDSAAYSGSLMRSLVGEELFSKKFNEKLVVAVDAGDAVLEDKLVASLGADVDWRTLYQRSKAPRHKSKYVESLRDENTYTSLTSAYDLSGDVADLDGAFALRSSDIANFIERIDIISNTESDQGIKRTVETYNNAPDIVAFRLQVVRNEEREEKERLVRLKEKEEREEKQRVARMEARAKTAERQRVAKKKAAIVLAKRKKNIGNSVSWNQSKRIDTDDCAGLFGIPVVCLWVTYEFKFEGEITGVSNGNNSYVARVERQELITPSFVSAKYLQMKNAGLNWAANQLESTVYVPFSDVDTY